MVSPGVGGVRRLSPMRNSSAAFGRYLQSWWERQLDDATYPTDWLHGRTSEALASEFRRDAQFELVQARYLHRRPNAENAHLLVDQLVPTPTETDVELLVRAVVRAGVTAQRVRTSGAIGASITVLALVARNILRRR
jgi:hypothetical protein